jgi:predicted lipid-binding transport protein (Tim44 family)
MRTLLQMLVFGMVLYQHCTWPRLCILLAGSIILYATALWAPFRQFILSLAMPPRPEQLAEMQLRRQQAAQQQRQAQQPAQQQQQPAQAAAAAGGQQQQQRQDGGAAAPAAPAAAGAAAEPRAEADAPAFAADLADARAGFPRGEVPLQPGLPAWLQRGIVREVLAVLLSFITSLLPGWNYNAEDAAVFAAAQEMMAREAREQQQQGQGQGAAAGGAAAAGDGVNAAA